MRRTLPVLLALFLLAVTLGLAACGPLSGGPAPAAYPTLLATPTEAGTITDASQLLGIWQVYDPHCTPGYMIIRSDGTYTWSCKPDGSDGLSGKYHFADGKFVVLNDMCGSAGQYRVNVAGDSPKALAFTVVNDSCDAEIQTLTGQKVTWVSAIP